MAPGVADGGGGTKGPLLIFFAPIHIVGCLGQSFELSIIVVILLVHCLNTCKPKYNGDHIHVRRPAQNLSSCIEIANTFSIVKQLTLTSLNLSLHIFYNAEQKLLISLDNFGERCQTFLHT